MFPKIRAAIPYFAAFTEYPFCTAGITTREGGVSKGHLSALNLGTRCGDEEAALSENYRRLAEAFGISYEKIVSTNQEHTDRVLRVGTEDAGRGIVRPRFSEGVDGLVTNEPHLPLLAYFADCVPVLFCDPRARAVGVCHSGWRGTVGKIAAKTAALMQTEFGSKSADIHAVIGPHIGACCFAVDAPVHEEFVKAFPENAGFSEKRGEKYYINLSAAVEKTLQDEGLTKIENMNICTACHSETFFSHRKTGGKRGCFAAVIAIR